MSPAAVAAGPAPTPVTGAAPAKAGTVAKGGDAFAALLAGAAAEVVLPADVAGAVAAGVAVADVEAAGGDQPAAAAPTDDGHDTDDAVDTADAEAMVAPVPPVVVAPTPAQVQVALEAASSVPLEGEATEHAASGMESAAAPASNAVAPVLTSAEAPGAAMISTIAAVAPEVGTRPTASVDPQRARSAATAPAAVTGEARVTVPEDAPAPAGKTPVAPRPDTYIPVRASISDADRGQPPARSLPAPAPAPAPPAAPAPAQAAPAVAPQPPAAIAPSPPAPPAAPVAPPAQPAPPALDAQLARPVFTLATAGRGEHVMTVHVTPDTLGPVTVRAHVGAEGVRVELFAPTDAGRDALRAILPDLRRDFSGSGLSGSLDLSSQNQPGPQQDAQERRAFAFAQRPEPQGDSPRGRELRPGTASTASVPGAAGHSIDLIV